MLQDAKCKGLTITVRHAKVLFCGAAKAGKTSFSRLLRNEEHDTDYASTPAADSQQVLISNKVNLVDTNWISLDSKLETQQITRRMIAKLQNPKGDKSPIHHNISENSKISTSHEKYSNFENVQSYQQTATKAAHISTDAKSKESIPWSESQPLAATSSSQQTLMTDDKIKSQDFSGPSNEHSSIQEQILRCTDIINAPDSEIKSIPKTWDLFTFLDTGGQPEFINMLPAINSSTAITLLF